jgi:acyl CoA:acetate/3-ketoacid CoA transferase beta subunit
MSRSEPSWTTAELMVSVLVKEIDDGDLLGQGLGTHLPAVAYYVARQTHAPRACILYSVGGSYSYQVRPLGLTTLHSAALTSPLRRVSYTEIVLDAMPSMRLKEFSRPAQVDRWGNTNNMVVGQYGQPRVRFPGAGGIPDFSPYSSLTTILYVPRHTPETFVERLDFRSGAGRHWVPSTDAPGTSSATGAGASRIVTNLGVIDFEVTGPTVTSLHPGVTAEEIRAATGFELSIADAVPVTPSPSVEVLRLIRSQIDPLGLRDLEFASASDRRAMIRAILAREAAAEAEVSRL